MQDSLRVALVQLTSGENISENAQSLTIAITTISEQSPVDLILFPENALYLRVEAGVQVPQIPVNDPVILQLQKTVDKTGAAIHLGSIPLDDNGVRRNSTVVLEPGKAPRALYHKIHLFDVDLQGQKPMRESDVFSHGIETAIWDYKGFKFGASICYDLRFSELYLRYALAKVDGILIPAAFTVPTGQAHWHVMLRARAIESQAYVLAAAQGGTHVSENKINQRQTYGHTLAVDPWGRVLLDLEDKVGSDKTGISTQWGIIELNKKIISDVRCQIPMSSHRRL